MAKEDPTKKNMFGSSLWVGKYLKNMGATIFVFRPTRLADLEAYKADGKWTAWDVFQVKKYLVGGFNPFEKY